MVAKILKTSLLFISSLLIAWILSFFAIDMSDAEIKNKPFFTVHTFKNMLFAMPRAQAARESRAERRARTRTERGRRNSKDAAAEQNAQQAEIAASQTSTTAQMENIESGPGPRAFSEDMTRFLDLPPEERKPVVAVEQEPVQDAQPEQNQSRRQRRGRASRDAAQTQQVMRSEVYSELEEAQVLYQEKKYDAALQLLNRLSSLKGRKALQSYEMANVWNFYAFIYYSKEQYDKAIQAYRKVLEQPALPKAMIDKTQYTVAQLQMVREDYPAAIKEFEKWFELAEKPGPDAYATLAQAYVQVKNYDKALDNMKKTLQAASAQNRQPKEQWYEVVRFLYNEKKMPKQESAALQVLLKYWPKKKYWLGLAGSYGESGNDKKQMEILNTLYVQSSLERESELVSLAQMFAGNEVPYKAAKIMERGLQEKKIAKTNLNLERTGEYWRQAHEIEKALPLLESASKMAADGKPSERLAYIYYGMARHVECATAAKRAIAKGGLRNINGLRMLIGQSLFNTQQFDEATRFFSLVQQQSVDENERIMAQQWLGYMEREKIRVQEIKQYLKS